MELAQTATISDIKVRRARRRIFENIFWYFVLCLIAIITVFPFIWVISTSFKGPNDLIYSVPPQIFPKDLTFDNYVRVWTQLPIANFFLNSIVVSVVSVSLNVLFTSLAAYPLAKMKFKGRDIIFYLLLATFIIPPQLTSIPSFVLAVNVFKFYDSILSLIFPALATVFNIFLLRQAFQERAQRPDRGGQARRSQ